MRCINKQTYYALKAHQDPKTETVVKDVVAFPHAANDFISLFLIETFRITGELVSVVNITTDNGEINGKYAVPEFLTIVGDVTGALSRKPTLLDV